MIFMHLFTFFIPSFLWGECTVKQYEVKVKVVRGYMCMQWGISSVI